MPSTAQLEAGLLRGRDHRLEKDPESRRVIHDAQVSKLVGEHVAHEMRRQEDEVTVERDGPSGRSAPPPGALPAHGDARGDDTRLGGKVSGKRRQDRVRGPVRNSSRRSATSASAREAHAARSATALRAVSSLRPGGNVTTSPSRAVTVRRTRRTRVLRRTAYSGSASARVSAVCACPRLTRHLSRCSW